MKPQSHTVVSYYSTRDMGLSPFDTKAICDRRSGYPLPELGLFIHTNPKAVAECDDISTACVSSGGLVDRHKNSSSRSTDPTWRDRPLHRSQSPCTPALCLALKLPDGATRCERLWLGTYRISSALADHTDLGTIVQAIVQL